MRAGQQCSKIWWGSQDDLSAKTLGCRQAVTAVASWSRKLLYLTSCVW